MMMIIIIINHTINIFCVCFFHIMIIINNMNNTNIQNIINVMIINIYNVIIIINSGSVSIVNMIINNMRF